MKLEINVYYHFVFLHIFDTMDNQVLFQITYIYAYHS